MNIPKYIQLLCDEMQLQNFAYSTQKSYKNCIKRFLELASAKFDEPIKISEEAIKKFLLWVQRKSSPAYQIQMTSAIKFFYTNIIKQPNKLTHTHYPKYEKKLPVILSLREMQTQSPELSKAKMKMLFGDFIKNLTNVEAWLKHKDFRESCNALTYLDAEERKELENENRNS